MKRLILAIMCIVMSVSASAQYDYYERTKVPAGYSEEPTIYYGLRVGLNIATVNSDDSRLDGGSAKTGINIGAIIGFQPSSTAPVLIETGLFYTENGGKGYVDGAKFTYDLNYLKVPIVVKYRYNIDENFSIQPFFGGYFALGVGGKVKNFQERETYSSFSENFFKRFDGGLKIGCGAAYNLIYAEMGYDLGLANVCHSDFDSSHTGCFYINCGVNF